MFNWNYDQYALLGCAKNKLQYGNQILLYITFRCWIFEYWWFSRIKFQFSMWFNQSFFERIFARTSFRKWNNHSHTIRSPIILQAFRLFYYIDHLIIRTICAKFNNRMIFEWITMHIVIYSYFNNVKHW